MTNAALLPVLLFNTTGPVHLMAQLHVEGCKALNRGGRGKVKVIRFATQQELDAEVADLNEREFPVRRCKCLK